MLYTAKQCENPLVITGFRNKDLIILQDDFKKAGAELVLTTDDGSAGIHGFVTDVLKEKISEVDEVCACGPTPMLKAIADVCKEEESRVRFLLRREWPAEWAHALCAQ